MDNSTEMSEGQGDNAQSRPAKQNPVRLVVQAVRQLGEVRGSAPHEIAKWVRANAREEHATSLSEGSVRVALHRASQQGLLEQVPGGRFQLPRGIDVYDALCCPKKKVRRSILRRRSCKKRRRSCRPKRRSCKRKKRTCKPKKRTCKPKKRRCKPKKRRCKPKKRPCKPKRRACPKKRRCSKRRKRSKSPSPCCCAPPKRRRRSCPKKKRPSCRSHQSGSSGRSPSATGSIYGITTAAKGCPACKALWRSKGRGPDARNQRCERCMKEMQLTALAEKELRKPAVRKELQERERMAKELDIE